MSVIKSAPYGVGRGIEALFFGAVALGRTDMSHHALIVGSGYVGLALLRRLSGAGVRVRSTYRRSEQSHLIQQLGGEAVALDLDLDPFTSSPALSVAATVVFFLAPPAGPGCIDARLHYFLSQLSPSNHPQRVVYISTTGVYGDYGGGWVDESSSVQPQTERGRRRLDAEQQLQQTAERLGFEWVILRVSGIYGPDRLPLARIQQQLPIISEQDAGMSNRIHLDDLVTVLMAAGERADACGIYNVSDGQPSSMGSYLSLVAKVAGLPQPPVVSMDEAHKVLSPTMLSYLQESRQIDNRRMVEQLRVRLRYKNLEQGLQAAWAAST